MSSLLLDGTRPVMRNGLAEFEQIIRDEYAAIGEVAKRAISFTVDGAPQAAVETLLAAAETSLNAKLIDLATQTLERHAKRIGDTQALQGRAEALNARYRSYGTQVRLSRADDPRTLVAVARKEG